MNKEFRPFTKEITKVSQTTVFKIVLFLIISKMELSQLLISLRSSINLELFQQFKQTKNQRKQWKES